MASHSYIGQDSNGPIYAANKCRYHWNKMLLIISIHTHREDNKKPIIRISQAKLQKVNQDFGAKLTIISINSPILAQSDHCNGLSYALTRTNKCNTYSTNKRTHAHTHTVLIPINRVWLSKTQSALQKNSSEWSGPSNPGAHLQSKSPKSLGMQMPPFRQGLVKHSLASSSCCCWFCTSLLPPASSLCRSSIPETQPAAVVMIIIIIDTQSASYIIIVVVINTQPVIIIIIITDIQPVPDIIIIITDTACDGHHHHCHHHHWCTASFSSSSSPLSATFVSARWATVDRSWRKEWN